MNEDFAIEWRYPGEELFPSLEETRTAIEIAEKVKEFVREKLKEKGFEVFDVVGNEQGRSREGHKNTSHR